MVVTFEETVSHEGGVTRVRVFDGDFLELANMCGEDLDVRAKGVTGAEVLSAVVLRAVEHMRAKGPSSAV